MIRMGGDEFVVLLPGCSEEKAGQIAKRIVGGCGEIDAGSEKVSVSIGVAISEKERDLAVKKLIELADHAMYVAKALGGSRFEIAEEDEEDAD
jgi:diguanylate cyclase (GGDEF)-like protein